MKIVAIFTIIASLFGCSKNDPHILDGPGMVYQDSDYRTEYANVFDFDSYEGKPYFAIAFLGYGDREDFRNTYVKGVFENLSDEETEKVRHFDFDGDEWYLIVPRYRESVDILDINSNIKQSVHQGEAFTVKCNLSDLHPNIEISTEDSYGTHRFSPQIGGDGRLVTNSDVHDITDYTVIDENLYIKKGD